MALQHDWVRTLSGVLDVQNWPTSSVFVNSAAFDAGLFGGATLSRGIFYPAVSVDVLATNQPVRDFVNEAMVMFSANFDVTGDSVTSDADTNDDTIVATALLEPTFFPPIGGTADYRVRWAPREGFVQSFGQRKANLGISSSASVNACIKIVDPTGAIPNVLNKNIFTSAQVLIASLWSHP